MSVKVEGKESKKNRQFFLEWFSDLLFACETALMRDVLRNQKENLWKEWKRVEPYASTQVDKLECLTCGVRYRFFHECEEVPSE